MTTRFIITSDLHQSIWKWRDLVRVVEQEKPRFVLIAGDLLPRDGGFDGQRKFFQVLANYLDARTPGSTGRGPCSACRPVRAAFIQL
jgi:hypothetical protein